MIGVGDSITLGFSASNIVTLSYVGLIRAQRGLGLVNYAISGATMLGGPAPGQASILAQMLAIDPPTHYEDVVMICGTNDIIAYGTDAGQLDAFADGLTDGLVYLTSRRRTPLPRNDRERLLVRQGRRLEAVPDAPRVFVGNCPKQSPYSGAASLPAQVAYSARIAATVATLYAQGRPVYLVDIASVFDPATQSPDGIHPDNSGHANIAAAFLDVMRTAA